MKLDVDELITYGEAQNKKRDLFCLNEYREIYPDDNFFLLERRSVLGLTQQEVADRAKITVQQYQKFESGERKIRSATFNICCKVLSALDVNIIYFYKTSLHIEAERYIDKDGVIRYAETDNPVPNKLLNYFQATESKVEESDHSTAELSDNSSLRS